MKAWVSNWRRNKGSDRPGYVQLTGWQYRDYVVSSCPFINAGDSDKLADHVLRKCMTVSIATATTDGWSLLDAPIAGGSELYNLRNDPNQEKNVVADHMDVARNLHQNLVRFMHETKLPKRLREPRLELNM